MEYEVTRTVAAGVDVAWRVLADPERWPQWTASMESVTLLDGALRTGARARVRQPRLPTAIWTVDDLVDGSSFVWSSRAPGVTVTAGHFLSAIDGDTTRLRLTIVSRGPLAPLMTLLLGKLTRRYVDLEADGLTRAAEQDAR